MKSTYIIYVSFIITWVGIFVIATIKSKVYSTIDSTKKTITEFLKAIVDNEQYYYDNLLKYDYDKLFVKKINESYKELDDVYKKLEKLIPSYSTYKLKNIKTQ
jgi:cell shape-determining protein MreC